MKELKTTNELQNQFINFFTSLKTKNDYALYPTFKISKLRVDEQFINQIENTFLKNLWYCYCTPSNTKIDCHTECLLLSQRLENNGYTIINQGIYTYNKFVFTYVIWLKDDLNYYCIYLSPSKTQITIYEIA